MPSDPLRRATLKPREWTSSVDLHVTLAHGGRRIGLERAIRTAVRGGRVQPGERLPSTRALAADLGLARGTVVEAYEQLTAEGYLRSRPGSPTRVAPRPVSPAEPRPTAPGTPPRPGPATTPLPAGPRPVRAPAPTPRYSLRVGVPDLNAFPRAAWQAALRRALTSIAPRTLGADDPRGRPELRVALAAYLGRARGVLAEPDRIVICAGYTEALSLVAATLRRRGARTIAMENPCLRDHRAVVAASGLRTAALPVDDSGATPDLPAAAGAVVLTPAHQFPLGATLGPDRRAAFVGWARSQAATIVEDDYDGEFRYDRQPVGALQGLDSDHVVYAGTASKTLTPGLRLGWLVVPRRLLGDIVEAKQIAGATHVLDQLALAELLRSGAYDRHVRRMRQHYRRRRDLLLRLLADNVPTLRPRGIAAGLHLVLDVPDEAALIDRAAEGSLSLSGLHPYWHSGTRDAASAVVLGYAAPAEHEYPATLAALRAALSGDAHPPRLSEKAPADIADRDLAAPASSAPSPVDEQSPQRAQQPP